jgi:hypothetical protein
MPDGKNRNGLNFMGMFYLMKKLAVPILSKRNIKKDSDRRAQMLKKRNASGWARFLSVQHAYFQGISLGKKTLSMDGEVFP